MYLASFLFQCIDDDLVFIYIIMMRRAIRRVLKNNHRVLNMNRIYSQRIIIGRHGKGSNVGEYFTSRINSYCDNQSINQSIDRSFWMNVWMYVSVLLKMKMKIIATDVERSSWSQSCCITQPMFECAGFPGWAGPAHACLQQRLVNYCSITAFNVTWWTSTHTVQYGSFQVFACNHRGTYAYGKIW